MAKWVTCSRIFSLVAGILAIALPVGLQAEGISLVADFEYFNTKQNSIAKDTGMVTDPQFSRFSQLYQVDIGRFVYPNVYCNLGGSFEKTDFDTKVKSPEPDDSYDRNSKEKTIRPYMEVNLSNPLYKAGLGYRKRDTETSGTFRPKETITVDDYNANLIWRPVDLPLLNINYQNIKLQDDPLTFDATRKTLNLVSKYIYKDVSFHYSYNRFDSFDKIAQNGNLSNNHNGGLSFGRGFDFKNTRFDVRASAKYIYDTIEFTGANAASATVDTPAADLGRPFSILDDATPTSNEQADLKYVADGFPLTRVNIGRDGGTNPVSAGLSFSAFTEVDTIYLQLSSDLETFPNLASSAQVAAIADSITGTFYSSDDQEDPEWDERDITGTFNSVDNRFEIRLAARVRARQIKITVLPLTLLAPGEIRYDSISAYTTVTGASAKNPENINQYYTLGLQWTLSSRTVAGYEGNYRNQEIRDTNDERTSWTHSLFFRQRINPIFALHGRVARNDRTRTNEKGKEDESDQLYNLSLRANYLDTLSQILTYTRARASEPEGSTTVNSVILRTNADLYTGWSMNLDLGYAFNTLLDGADQTTRSVRVGTIVEPNRNININLDYTMTSTDETGQVDSRSQYGTFQVLWVVTNTLNMFFRYNFRKQDGRNDISTSLREYNINWAPFPDGTLQFSIGYNETTDFADQEIKTISPTLAWKVARGIFLDLRYTTGTIESPTESTDLDSAIAKLKIFY